MAARFGNTPPEPPTIHSLVGCAPGFVAAIEQVLVGMQGAGWPCVVRESLRTPERQAWLYGIGRTYDPDGRGIVTNAPTAEHGRHLGGLAVDIVHATKGDTAPKAFWETLATMAEAEGLSAGWRWQHADPPHLQWKCPTITPTPEEMRVQREGGNEALWAMVGAL